jgi:hypothetical protein
LFNPNIIKSFNYYAIENLKFDIETLDNYFHSLAMTHPGFDECLLPVKEVLSIFFSKRIEGFIEANKKVDTFYGVKIDQLCKFLMKYKNLKKPSEMKGRITESEIVGFVKKLKEYQAKK